MNAGTEFFLYTCDIGSPVYKILTESAKKHAEAKLNRVLRLKRFEISNCLTFHGFLFVVSLAFRVFLLRSDALVQLQYRGYDVGRHSVAATLRNVKSNNNFFLYYYVLIRKIIRGVLIVDCGEAVVEYVKAAYVDHNVYLNGLLLQVLLKRGICVYSNEYPFSLSCARCSSSIDRVVKYEEISMLSKVEIDFHGKKQAEFKLREILGDTNSIPYMDVEMESPGIFPRENVVVLYVHSFTDAQMMYGYDGFKSVYDWLLFSIEKLTELKKNIIIKGHPNFYGRSQHVTVLMDKKLFGHVCNKFVGQDNIFFLTRPVSNYDFLRELDPASTALVSHHSFSVVEGAFMGFKSISSSRSPWRNEFKVSNVWSDPQEYEKLLKLDVSDLVPPTYEDIISLVYANHCNEYGFFGRRFWQDIIAEEFSISRKSIIDDPHSIKGTDLQFHNAIQRIAGAVRSLEISN